jgi:hypothetical protein
MQVAEHNDYSILIDILWSINQDASGLDSNKIEQLMDLSQNNTKPGCLARNVLVANGIINYCEPIVIADELKSTEAKPYRPRNISHSNSRLDVFPNPAKEYIIISYDLTGLQGNFYIEIINPEGKALIRQNLSGIENQVVISTASLTSSPHILRLISESSCIETIRFIILK